MIKPLWLTYLLRQFWRNKARTVLTIVGIALGVAITLAIQLTNYTAIQQFKQSVDVVSGQATASIFPTITRTLDESILFDLTSLWQYGAQYTPVLELNGIYQSPHSKNKATLPLKILGVDMVVDGFIRPLEFDTPPKDSQGIFSSNTCYISKALADEHKLTINQPLNVMLGEQWVQLHIIGIIKNQGIGQAYGGDVVLMDIAQAQQLLNQSGKISRIDIQAPQKTGWTDAFKTHIQTLLPTHAVLSTVQDQSQQGDKLFAAFQTNLTALSFIGLLVGMFLMYNTMSISILRRQTDIGILRTLAFTRLDIFQLFFVELLMYGFLGSLLGVGLGVLMAQQSTRLISTTVQTLYTGLPLHQVSISLPWIGVVFIFGIITTLLAGLIPLWQSTHIQPALAVRRSARELNSKYSWCGLFGFLCFVVSGWASQQPAINGLPLWGHVCSFTFILGAAFFVPLILPMSLRMLGALLTWEFSLFRTLLKFLNQHSLSQYFEGFQLSAKLAQKQLLLHRGRTSVAIASLMMAIAMVISIGIMIHSFRETLTLWVNQSITADIWIEPSGPNQVVKRYIDSNIVDKIRTVDGVIAVDPFLEEPITFRGEPTRLAVGDFNVFEQFGNLHFLSGRSSSHVMKDALEKKGVVITEPFSKRFNLSAGDTLTLPTPNGEKSIPIIDVYRDYSSEQGFVVFNRDTYQQLFPPGNELTGIAVYTNPQADITQIRRDIIQKKSVNNVLNIQTRAGLKQEIFTIFEQTFAITHALHLISIFVAILAILNTLLSLMLELKREFSILNYIGVSMRHVQAIVICQAGIIGTLSSLLALPVGIILSLFLVYVINVQAFGWTIDYRCPIDFLLEATLAVILVSLLIGFIPAGMISQAVTPSSLREE